MSDIAARTSFFALSSSSSHSRPKYTVCPASANANSAIVTRPINRRFRSLVDSEPFDDLAPVVCDSFWNSGGEKSKVGTPVSGLVGSGAAGDGSALAVASVLGGGGGGVAVGFDFTVLLGGTVDFCDTYRTDCTRVRRGIDLERIENITPAARW